jgi:hypothetical protein
MLRREFLTAPLAGLVPVEKPAQVAHTKETYSFPSGGGFVSTCAANRNILRITVENQFLTEVGVFKVFVNNKRVINNTYTGQINYFNHTHSSFNSNTLGNKSILLETSVSSIVTIYYSHPYPESV